LNKATDETAEPILTRNISKRVSAGSAYLWDQNNNFTILVGQIPQNSPKWARISILQPNPRSRKIAIYRSSMKLFASNLTVTDWKRGEI